MRKTTTKETEARVDQHDRSCVTNRDAGADQHIRAVGGRLWGHGVVVRVVQVGQDSAVESFIFSVGEISLE